MAQVFCFPQAQGIDSNVRLLVGAQLLFEKTGTTTPQTVYKDAALTTPHDNPVVADSAGVWAPIYLDDTQVAYRVTLFSSVATGSTLIRGPIDPCNPFVSTLTQNAVGVALYPKSVAELAGGITPINYSYPHGCVDRYGTNSVPGTTDMTAAWNAALKQAKQPGGAVITFGATGWYYTSAPLDATFTGTANQNGILIRPVSGPSQDQGHGILADHSGVAIFDCTGCDSFVAYDLNIVSPVGRAAGFCPATGIFWARSSFGESAYHRLFNCRVVGSYSVAPFYNYGTEDTLLSGCYFANYCTSPTTCTRVYTANNRYALHSTFVSVFSGAVSTTDQTVIGCQDYNAAGTSTSDCVFLEGVAGYASYGGWAYSASPSANGRALHFIDQGFFGSSNITIIGQKCETSTFQQQYGMLISNDAQTATAFTIDSCFWPNASYAIATQGALPILDNFRIRGISEQASHGAAIQGVLQNSTLETATMPLIIATSKRNKLEGFKENWTITTRDDDFWIDQGVAGKVWTPALGTMAHGGVLTISEARCLFHGNMVTVSCLISDTVSLTATAGQTITGLPAAAKYRSADVQVANANTGAAIGAGFIDATATAIKMPAVSTGANVAICVTARYLVA